MLFLFFIPCAYLDFVLYIEDNVLSFLCGVGDYGLSYPKFFVPKFSCLCFFLINILLSIEPACVGVLDNI